MTTESNSLTHARSLIGLKQRSSTSGEIQESHKLAYVDARNVTIYTELAVEIISSTLREAVFYLNYTNNSVKVDRKCEEHIKESKIAMQFIQGTGLEAMIKFYNLSYDPDEIREKFNEIFRIK